MQGIITEKTEFLFPDMELGVMKQEIHLASAENGKAGIQIIFECAEPYAYISLEKKGIGIEYFQMIDIPVECNRGKGGNGGEPGPKEELVIYPDECPPYAIRKAPFRVYDCLKPLQKGEVASANGRVAVYVCLSPEKDTKAGIYNMSLNICAGEEIHTCKIVYQVYPVQIEKGRFDHVTWYTEANIEKYHNTNRKDPEFPEVLRTYAKAMRRGGQNIFTLSLQPDEERQIKERPFHFTFEKLKPILDVFLEEGFDTLQVMATVSTQAFLEDGKMDFDFPDLQFILARDIPFDSEEGYEFYSSLMRDFALFMKQNRYPFKMIFSVCDEPAGDNRDKAIIQNKRKQYCMATNVVKRYFPDAKILEALADCDYDFAWAIDIHIPITIFYDRRKSFFDGMRALGNTIWLYVGCFPIGYGLNRLLDCPLNDLRLLFWGCAANRINGFLHWGLNQYQFMEGDPFKSTRVLNDYGGDHNRDFPCGDAFIVYPGEDGAWPSMRLEAQGRGIEDAILLDMLDEKDPKAHDEIIAKVFTDFNTYDDDAEKMEQVHRELLERLS